MFPVNVPWWMFPVNVPGVSLATVSKQTARQKCVAPNHASWSTDCTFCHEMNTMSFVSSSPVSFWCKWSDVTSRARRKKRGGRGGKGRERKRERDTHTHLLRNITKNETPRMDCNQGTVPAVANSEFLMPADCRWDGKWKKSFSIIHYDTHETESQKSQKSCQTKPYESKSTGVKIKYQQLHKPANPEHQIQQFKDCSNLQNSQNSQARQNKCVECVECIECSTKLKLLYYI